MSDDRREGQSKFDRPAAASGLARPPAPPMPAAPAQPAPAPPPTPALPIAPVLVPAAAPVAAAEAYDDSEYEEDEMPPTLVERLRRLSPAPVILTLGSIGSVVFLLFAVTSHTTPVAVLLSAAVVTGLIFGADALVASVVTWRASQNGETGLAFLASIVGGIASLVCFGAFAGTLVLILVLNS